MDLRSLRYLLAVAEAGSVSAAARGLHLTQPALSRSIAALERQVGVLLFERSGGPLVPTSACRRLLPIARDLISRAETAERLFHALTDGSRISFRIACPESTVRHVVAPFLAETSAPVDDAHGLPPSAVHQAVIGRDADLAVNTLTAPPALASCPIGHIGVGAYMRADHPLARESGPLHVGELARHDLVLMGRGSAVRDAFDRAVGGAVVARMRVAAEPDSSAMAQALAATGAGVSVTLDPPGYGLVVRPVHTGDGPLRISLCAAWEPTHYAAARLEALAEQLAAWFAARSGTAESVRWYPATSSASGPGRERPAVG